MRTYTVLAVALTLALASCKGPTPAGEPGKWSMTKYLTRYYAVDAETATEAGRNYFKQKGYTEDFTDRAERKGQLLHGFTKERMSLILRTRARGDMLTEVKIKAGPAYDLDETIAMLDEYQALLPEAARPK